ncbi:hypothetical protein M9H77_12783 [Catharanthus roseus]|uniref:Uncharacterized protein n=1 Tax=Catharanthus roseus TaxID=4058 RepID=A0ACC0BIH7_CATRO|nr:hypothetical protein M9H77_12783 [Catharanthus roseus]
MLIHQVNTIDDAFQLAYMIERRQKQPAKLFPSQVEEAINTRKFISDTSGTNFTAISANNKLNNGRKRGQMAESKRQDANLECFNCGLSGHYAWECPKKIYLHTVVEPNEEQEVEEGKKTDFFGRIEGLDDNDLEEEEEDTTILSTRLKRAKEEEKVKNEELAPGSSKTGPDLKQKTKDSKPRVSGAGFVQNWARFAAAQFFYYKYLGVNSILNWGSISCENIRRNVGLLAWAFQEQAWKFKFHQPSSS